MRCNVNNRLMHDIKDNLLRAVSVTHKHIKINCRRMVQGAIVARTPFTLGPHRITSYLMLRASNR